MMRRVIAVATSPVRTCAVALVICYAANAAQPSARSTGPETVLSTKLSLRSLVELVVATSETPIQFDARILDVQGEFRIPSGLDEFELRGLMWDALERNGLAIFRSGSGSVLQIDQTSRAQELAVVDAGIESIDSLAGFVRVKLRFATPLPDARTTDMKSLVGQNGKITQLDDGRALIVAGARSRVLGAARFVREWQDHRSATAPTYFVWSPRHSDATTVATRVNALRLDQDPDSATIVPAGKIVPTHGDASLTVVAPPPTHENWLTLLNDLDRPSEMVRRSYRPKFDDLSGVAELCISIANEDRRRLGAAPPVVTQNSILGTIDVLASPAAHEKIESMLAELESLPPSARTQIASIPVVNRDATKFAELLSSVLRHADVDSAVNDGAPPSRDEEIPTDTRHIGVDAPDVPITMLVDQPTNSLIVRGTTRDIEQVRRLVDQLDIRQPQVMIEIMIVSLSESDTFDLGVELAKSELDGSTIVELASLFGFGLSGTTETPASSNGGSGVVINPGDFAVVVRALQTLNEGRSVSLPKALVDNNETATLNAVLQQPVASINASSTVATTSFNGFEDAGTSITVTPQISSGDRLTLQYDVELGTFVGDSADPSLPPPRQQNTLSSRSTIPDGYTVVLGGLDVETDGEAVSQVPLLGDIPFVGELFKSRSRTTTRSRFFVFLRADVLRHSGFEDLKYLSDENRRAASLPPDWPESTPRIIR